MRIGEAMMGDETDRRKEEDDERVNWRLAEKMKNILKEKQKTAETIEQEPDGGDDRAGRGPRESACKSASKMRWPSGVKGGVQEERNEDCRRPRRCKERTRDRERMHPRWSRRSCPWTFL